MRIALHLPGYWFHNSKWLTMRGLALAFFIATMAVLISATAQAQLPNTLIVRHPALPKFVITLTKTGNSWSARNQDGIDGQVTNLANAHYKEGQSFSFTVNFSKDSHGCKIIGYTGKVAGNRIVGTYYGSLCGPRGDFTIDNFSSTAISAPPPPPPYTPPHTGAVVVQTFQGALPPAGSAMSAWSTHVTITWVTATGERRVNKGIFWQPSVKPGVLPALPLGQITFLDQGRLDQVFQFPATVLVSIEAEALIKWRGEGPAQLPPIARPELTFRDVDRGFYATSGTSTQVHPALFFIPVPPTAVELSGSGVNMFGPGGAILPEQVPTFLVNRLPARAGNADPMPENVFTTAHTASILSNPAVWPGIASPVSSGWHQLFASQGPQQKPPRLVSSIRIRFGAAAAGGIPPPRPALGRVPLNLYYSSARGDNFTTGTSVGEQSAQSSGYGFARIEGYGFRDPQPGTVPLKLYWNAARGDNFTTASAQGEQAALASGYVFVRVEAYIYPTQQPGTVPLKNYWNQARGDNFSTATAIGEQNARDSGYVFTWIEGYVFPAGTSP